ncbi:chaperonin 10-like protein [Microdochium trichocladiopsis]|uniref:Chaperonin 10-like protein n=1 Tax=Microdochium trichocladiopsis TaxID=1682393 RepID=A0A9P8Y2Y9_9PEZI|nr:chaperonin 10-like protein [Microdochium trichocladiopsis]KAH7026579.1 chaperonin 10-like protein [Microdochium trichocladiopsis]
MVTFTAYKGHKSGKIQKSTITKPDKLEGDQVLVKITASGVCYTDIHFKTSDMVLGHEGIGVVEKVGPTCKVLKPGQRVGWGYTHDSCGHCQPCLRGDEIYCPQRAMYAEADLDQGSFASHAIWRKAFLFEIPDALSDEQAAPLQCGGATVFNALRAYNTQATETVGVMGVGGLGHLAIKFASKMGCRVVVLSGTESKRAEAMQLGASEFVATKGKKQLKVLQPLDRLLVTTSAQPNWEQIMPIMAPCASIHPLSIADGNFEVPYMPLLTKGMTIQGSVVAPRHVHKDMLEFAALHDVKPVTQTFPLTEKGVAEAMDKLEKGELHFRAVLIAQK